MQDANEMQAEAEAQPIEQTAAETPVRIVITVEVIAYLMLVALALVLRLAELDTIPLTAGEARQALAAWQVAHPASDRVIIIAQSPIQALAQQFAFVVFGGTEAASRLPTALAGAVLVLLPLLFRDLLGRTGVFLFSVLLVFSPELLIASRFADPVVWSLLLAILGVWALRRYGQRQQSGYALAAVVLFAGLVLLAEPGGPLLALMLAGAGLLTVLFKPADVDDEFAADTPSTESLSVLRSFPWLQGLGLAFVVVALVGTGFMLYPSGLSAIGAVLEGFARGFGVSPDGMSFFPLYVSLYYAPMLWVFAIVGIALTLDRGGLTPLDRFFIGWLALATVAALVFGSAQSGHSLWFIVPLIGLAISPIEALLAQDDEGSLWRMPGWARWVLAVLSIALLAAFSVSLQLVARSLLRSPDGLPALLQSGGMPTGTNIDPVGAILVLMTLLFMVVGFFLAASVWDVKTAVRGAGLGLLLFGMVTALGSGWNAAVVHADNPVELWQRGTATNKDTTLLRATLLDVANRESRGFPSLPVTVMAARDGVIAWLLRDFVDVRYIGSPAEATGQRVVILPADPNGDIAHPDLGGNYVGQDFIISKTWSPQSMLGLDTLAWWTERRTRYPGVPTQRVVLWLREDVYEGVDFTDGFGR